MKMRTVSGALAVVATVGALAVLVAPPLHAQDARATAESNAQFAVDLYRTVSGTEGNLVFSPHSVASALAMVCAGARAETAVEMTQALHLTGGDVHGGFRALHASLNTATSRDDLRLRIANGLCVTGRYEVRQEYKTLLQESYAAEIFSGKLEDVNGWCKAKTEGKIERILEYLDGNSVCVLLNAVYFKGTWAAKFDPKLTRDAPFQVAPDRLVNVPMMTQSVLAPLVDDNGVTILSLAYVRDRIEMVLVLPEARDGLSQVERELTHERLAGWLKKLDKETQRVAALSNERRGEASFRVDLPRFGVSSGYDLIPPLKALGVRRAFSFGVADLSGIGSAPGDYIIGQARHKARIDVNEEGAEAVAATAVEIVGKAAGRPRSFRADHPFLFLIRDRETGAILFMGRVVDPSASGVPEASPGPAAGPTK